LDQTFFGYESKDRIKLHEQLFELVWAGEGKWSLETIYNMPLPMRKFWIDKLNEKIQQRIQTNAKSSNIIKRPPVTK
jgi:23S rRNA C2498 (ribose-2'-O)-methylase RlmM